MKQQKNSAVVLIAGMVLLGSSMLHAQPKFSIIPTSGAITSLLLPANFTETVNYQVTNQTNITRTLTMVPITGVTQISVQRRGAATCSNPFVLAPAQTCTLSLVINGRQVPSAGINGGPVICKTMGAGNNNPDPLLCSQPDIGNTLAVSVTTSGQHAYVANQLANSVSFCQVNPATGLLTQCAVTATGLSGLEGIGFNPAGTFFYSANALTNSISVCTVNPSTGALSGCVDSGGTGFNLDNAISFNPAGNILYTANLGGLGSVSACIVNPTTGQLSGCVNNNSPTFGAPADMAVNSAGTFAYVANRSASTVSVCNVSGQLVNSCNAASGSNFSSPEGVTLSADNLHAYIANAGSKSITVCDILQDGTGLLANCSVTGGQFVGTGNLGLNNVGTIAYVPNQLLSAIFACDVTRLTGQLSGCKPALGSGFVGPAGVVLH
jgi:DNA-binding beta-propeller fold protein YncE